MKRYNRKLKEAGKYQEIKYTDANDKFKSLEVIPQKDIIDDFILIILKNLKYPDKMMYFNKKDAKTLCKQIMNEVI
jgi:hypothetical protein